MTSVSLHPAFCARICSVEKSGSRGGRRRHGEKSILSLFKIRTLAPLKNKKKKTKKKQNPPSKSIDLMLKECAIQGENGHSVFNHWLCSSLLISYLVQPHRTGLYQHLFHRKGHSLEWLCPEQQLTSLPPFSLKRLHFETLPFAASTSSTVHTLPPITSTS